jgi:hypothetical protein
LVAPNDAQIGECAPGDVDYFARSGDRMYGSVVKQALVDSLLTHAV